MLPFSQCVFCLCISWKKKSSVTLHLHNYTSFSLSLPSSLPPSHFSFTLSLPPFLPSTEQVYHVTIPHQPSAVYNEAILKLSSTTQITVVAPSTGKSVLEIPYKSIRRMGCMDNQGIIVIWFETCKNSLPDNFIFFTIPSGIEVGHAIIHEMKTIIECSIGVLLIMEDGGELDISFISKEHYGCQEFSTKVREQILQASLRQRPTGWRPFIRDERARRMSEPALRVNEVSSGVSLEDWASSKARRLTSTTGHPLTLTRKHTLEQLRRPSTSSSEHGSASLEIPDGQGSDSGFNSDVFEPPTGSPTRKHSHRSSFSSHDGSGSSLPYSPTIAEDEILEDPFESATPSYIPLHRSSAPHVPPRSIISLQQVAYSKRKTSTSSVHWLHFTVPTLICLRQLLVLSVYVCKCVFTVLAVLSVYKHITCIQLAGSHLKNCSAYRNFFMDITLTILYQYCNLT